MFSRISRGSPVSAVSHERTPTVAPPDGRQKRIAVRRAETPRRSPSRCGPVARPAGWAAVVSQIRTWKSRPRVSSKRPAGSKHRARDFLRVRYRRTQGLARRRVPEIDAIPAYRAGPAAVGAELGGADGIGMTHQRVERDRPLDVPELSGPIVPSCHDRPAVGLNATARICPGSRSGPCTGSPVDESHTKQVRSRLPVTKVRPFLGLKATELTRRVCSLQRPDWCRRVRFSTSGEALPGRRRPSPAPGRRD